MDLQATLKLFRRYWRSMVAVTLTGLLAAAALSILQRPVYQGSASLFVSVESGGTAGELSQGASFAEQQVQSYAQVGSTSAVLQPVIDRLHLTETPRQLLTRVDTTPLSGTSIIQVTARANTQEDAAALANAVATSLAEAIGNLSPSNPSGKRLVGATVIEQAAPPLRAIAPRPTMYLGLGFVLGLLLGIGQAQLRSMTDTRVRTAADVADLTELPLLATVAQHATRRSTDAKAVNDEAYRRLRMNVGFTGVGGEFKPSLVITSATASEGKTETAVNLARAMARSGATVLLLDADMRRPMVAKRAGHEDESVGLSDLLTSRIELDDVLIPDKHEKRLHMVAAGTIPPNPSELLGSKRMAMLLAWAEEAYDYVIIDTPPVLPVTDAAILAARVGGVLLVARHGIVKRPELTHALELLAAARARVVGIVLNGVPGTLGGTYGRYYTPSAQPDESLSQEDIVPAALGSSRYQADA